MTNEKRWIERVKLLEARLKTISFLTAGHPREGVPLEFAAGMSKKLLEPQNVAKGGWTPENVTIEDLLFMLRCEVVELENEVCDSSDDAEAARRKRIRDECVDVSNFAMMIWDRSR